MSSKQIFLILLLALAARVWYVSDIREFPFFTTPVGDEAAYHATATHILNGDLLAGKRVYYQDPFYPYFLAGIYEFTGVDIVAPKYIQLLLGLVSVLLIALITGSCFGPTAAIIAGVVAALYPLFYFFEAQLLKSSLVVLFTVALFWLLLRYYDTRKKKFLFWAGCAAGLGCVSQGHTYFFVPAVFLWLAQISSANPLTPLTPLSQRGELILLPSFVKEGLREFFHRCALFTAGMLIMILPFTLRNWVVAHEFVLTTYQAGTNFYMGNHAKADGVYEPLRAGRDLPPFEEIDAVEIAQKLSGKNLRASEVSSFWFARSFKYIAGDPVGWINLLARKARIYANFAEVPDVLEYSFVREHSPLLRLPLLNFGFIFPLGLLGMFIALRPSVMAPRRCDSDKVPLGEKNEKALLLAYGALASAFAVILFYVFSRYRLQSVPFYLIFSVYGCLKLWEWRKARKNGKLIAVVIALIALLAFSNYDMHAYSPGLGEGLLGSLAIKQKQYPQAISYYEKVLAQNPTNVALLASTDKIIAQCYFEMGNYERAIVVIDTALALYKQNPTSLDREALYEMLAMCAVAHQRTKDYDGARKILDQLLVQFPQRLETHVSLGTVYKRMKMDSEAEKEFTYVLNIDTMNVVACNNLANILRDKGNFAAADKLYRQSLLLSPGNPVILKNVERLKQVSKGRYGK